MTTKINIDAMIPRADFALQRKAMDTVDSHPTLGVEQLLDSSMVMKSLRKPDFQRETNHWTALQLVNFLKSFVDRELIPSVILWQSESNIFVIDGAHRLSALRAWINDDYGDGPISQKYYGHEIPNAQKKSAQRVRRLIETEIRTFSYLRSASGESDGFSEIVTERASTITSRSLSLQWVSGDAAKAESSFFKINTQGTPLHKTEDRLLRNRKTPLAISARAIARAATGNKYWSQFDDDAKEKIEERARDVHNLLFTPEVDQPIKTLDLPLGGTNSLTDSLNLLMDFIDVSVGQSGLKELLSKDDLNGESTIKILDRSLKILKRITGNDAGSLGLHPAVYFYNQRGKHSQHLFIAIIAVFTSKLDQNDKSFFPKFIAARSGLETFIIENKLLISQAIVNIGSSSRVSRLSDMFSELIDRLSKNKTVTSDELLVILKLEGKLVAGYMSASKSFAKETKSEIYLNASLSAALTCPICNGFIDDKSISYDHVVRVRDGGMGSASNGQITHPFCNSAIKN